MRIPVGISNRHVHLTEETKNKIFGTSYNLEIKRNLAQEGEYASFSTVSLRTPNGVIENVRVIGPLRDYNQVELLESDAKILGVYPPKRNSGDLDNSENLTLVGDKGSTYLENVCIIANRHIHMNPQEATESNLKNNDIVKIKYKDKIIDDVHIKVKNNYVLECHLDKDDELKYDIHNYDEVELLSNG